MSTHSQFKEVDKSSITGFVLCVASSRENLFITTNMAQKTSATTISASVNNYGTYYSFFCSIFQCGCLRQNMSLLSITPAQYIVESILTFKLTLKYFRVLKVFTMHFYSPHLRQYMVKSLHTSIHCEE